MREFLRLHVVALVLLAGCGARPLNTTPAVTAVGSPAGHPATQDIGPEGGTLTSLDGLLTLQVPAGAVDRRTTFSVDALGTTAPGALRAYRLGPEGTTFFTPATLIFALGADDLAGSTASGLSAGYQDADHHWRLLSNATVSADSTQLRVTTGHLSDWSLVRGWQVRPPSATVKPGGSVALTVTYCNQVNVGTGQDELYTLAAECEKDGEELGLPLMHWAVNGAAGGSASTGSVDQGNPTATYTAPSKSPGAPVAVSVEFGPPRAAIKVLLVSNITVADETPPAGYSGTLRIDTTSGHVGTDYTELDYSGQAKVQLTPWPELGRTTYHLAGTLTLSSVTVELGGCLCTGSGAAEVPGAMGSGSFSYHPSSVGAGGTYVLGFSTVVPVNLSCSPAASGADCSSRTTTLTVGWTAQDSFLQGCTGSVTDTYTDVKSIAGSWQQSCPAFTKKNQTVSWSFTATP